MAVKFKVIVPEDDGFSVLNQLVAGLEDKTALNFFVGREVKGFTSSYLAKLGTTRHATAERLGAKPTGFLAKAAESVTFDADADSAFIDINAPGFSQAFGDLVITPGPGKKYLTIPTHPEAYGVSARDVGGETFIVALGGDSTNLPSRPGSSSSTSRAEDPRATLVIAREGAEPDSLEVLYVLVKRARKKQDRSLLPSDQDIGDASELGALKYIEHVEAEATGAAVFSPR